MFVTRLLSKRKTVDQAMKPITKIVTNLQVIADQNANNAARHSEEIARREALAAAAIAESQKATTQARKLADWVG